MQPLHARMHAWMLALALSMHAWLLLLPAYFLQHNYREEQLI